MDALALHSSAAAAVSGWPSLSSFLPTRSLLQAFDSCGIFECMPGEMGPRVLRISLVSASGRRLRGGFYFETFSEPAAGHPKNSRIHHHHHLSGGSVDLGCEQLELDWFGDEREVVVHLVEYSGSKQSRDLPVCELRIPRDAVERYAREARGQLDVRFGCRSFSMAPMARQDALQRKRRFQDMLPSGIASRIFAKLGEEQGLLIPSSSELESLQAENAMLKKEHGTLLRQSGMPGGAHATMAAAASALQDDVGITLRFELLPRREAGHGAVGLPYRKASFQETIEVA